MSKTKPPKRSVEDQQFLDIAAIQFMAARIAQGPFPFMDTAPLAATAFLQAEALLNERNKRL